MGLTEASGIAEASAASASADLPEYQRYLAAWPQTEAVEYLISDSNGVLRGKWAPAGSISKAFKEGVNFPMSMFGLDVWGREVMETGLHVDTGDRDGFRRAGRGTLRPVPWADRPTAQCILTMHTERGQPFHGDPRNLLERVQERIEAAGYIPCVAMELEFYLTDPRAQPAANGMLQPVFQGVGGPVPQNMYALSDLAQYGPVFSDIWSFGKAQGLPIDTMVSEAAPGQFEVNLKHRADALAAADDAVMLRLLVTEVARRHGLRASFMAKPYIDSAGNGLHVHVSLVDRQGRNLYADESTGETLLRHSIGGLMESMPSMTLVFVPTFNGYRRLQPGSYAPTTVSWGHNNRSVGIRIPASPPEARRLEHRIAGADANPYLVMAAILAGMLEGIERQITPPPPVNINAYEEMVPRLPDDMGEAIRQFERSDFARRLFGVEYRALFAHLKRAERREFEREITPLERMTYL